MNKFNHLLQFVQSLFDEKETAEKAKHIIEGILKAHWPRFSDIARKMAGKEDRNYKWIQRFLEKTSPQETWLRLFQESALFVIGDPTEMPRPHTLFRLVRSSSPALSSFQSYLLPVRSILCTSEHVVTASIKLHLS